MESMKARVDKELSIVENGAEADITCLTRVYSNILVPLAALLSTELFGIG